MKPPTPVHLTVHFLAALKALALGDLFKFFSLDITFARKVCRLGIKMKKIRQSSYSFHYPQWQTARANVMANLTSLNRCKERFSMNSLFASNIIYSFQIFVLTLFLVIHTEFA